MRDLRTQNKKQFKTKWLLKFFPQTQSDDFLARPNLDASEIPNQDKICHFNVTYSVTHPAGGTKDPDSARLSGIGAQGPRRVEPERQRGPTGNRPTPQRSALLGAAVTAAGGSGLLDLCRRRHGYGLPRSGVRARPGAAVGHVGYQVARAEGRVLLEVEEGAYRHPAEGEETTAVLREGLKAGEVGDHLGPTGCARKGCRRGFWCPDSDCGSGWGGPEGSAAQPSQETATVFRGGADAVRAWPEG